MTPLQQARWQRHRDELSRRVWICVAGWLPLAFALVLFMFEGHAEKSVFDLFFRMHEIHWLGIWAVLLFVLAVLGAAIQRRFWRCPACEKFLAGKSGDHGPHCAARL